MFTFQLLWVVLAAIFIRLLFTGRRPKNYPPGPLTLPILGNIHLMPKKDAHLQFRNWADEYGPVYSLILGTKPFIVLSSAQAVKDLLDKKSVLYSDRQEMYVGQTLGSGGLRFLMMTANTILKFRKLVHSLLNVTAAKSDMPYQDLENKQMLYEMVTQPDQFLQSIRRYSNALTTTMVFGWRSPIYHDPKLMQLFDGFSEFADLNQTGIAALLESFPPLRKLPNFLVPVQRKAKELHQKEKDLYVSHWLKAKQDIANVRFMLLYPEVQRKAQYELDKVVGSGRMPTMDDEQSLQYIRACMKETLRWMPTTILGAVPHAVTQDDTYNGYLIPKGAGVLNNVWGIHMDPERFPNPRQFDPERYRDDLQSLGDAAANPDASKRDQFTFGAGRRICPEIHVAERSLSLGMSRILWALNIEPALDKERNTILPDLDKLTKGFVCMPEEFPAKITPRSKERETMVLNSWKKAEEESLDPVAKQWR
ncbi:hypothetical protein ACHAP5_009532 [Fusarium lateritium]